MENSVISQSECPCGSLLPYVECCGMYHTQKTHAPTAETLMRSRYSAFVLQLSEYVLATWDKTTRPKTLDFEEDQTVWTRLEILNCKKGLAKDEKGLVEFKAHYQLHDKEYILHELSRFVRRQGQWFYLDGTVKAIAKPKVETALGLNAACACGSGKKFKRCCGKAGRA